MKRRGFTLIELLVVIAVIGILASIVGVSVGNSRMRARDVKRKTDLKQMSSAIEQYAVNNGAYPNYKTFNNTDNPSLWPDNLPGEPGYMGPSIISGCVNTNAGTAYTWGNAKGWQVLQTTLANFIQILPVDPLVRCNSYTYIGSNENIATNPNSFPAYSYISHYGGQHYNFVVRLENDKDGDTNAEGTASSWTSNDANTKGRFTKPGGLRYRHNLIYTGTDETKATLMGAGGSIQ